MVLFRPDLEGLRGFAALCVVLYHFAPTVVSGGYVGVTVFFVLAGYLIPLDDVSWCEIFRRKTLRIAPAANVLAAIVTLLSFGLLLHEDFRKEVKSAVAASLSMANIYFWWFADESYFAADTRESPLLHLWALGCEEQFSWLFSVFLLVGRDRHLLMMVTSLLLAILSVSLCLFFDFSSLATYYLLPFRGAEFLVGASLRMMTTLLESSDNVYGGYNAISSFLFTQQFEHFLSLFGFMAIVLSAFLFDAATPYPTYRALLPALGTAAYIYAGSGCGAGRHRTFSSSPLEADETAHSSSSPSPINLVLSLAPFTWLGRISYSIYLYHWPLISITYYHRIDILHSPRIFLACLGIVGAVSYASYILVETPTRRLKLSVCRVVALRILAVICFSSLLLLSPVGSSTENAGNDFEEPPPPIGVLDGSLLDYRDVFHNVSVAEAARLSETEAELPSFLNNLVIREKYNMTGGAGSPSVELMFGLFGDSFAQQIFPLLDTLGVTYGFKFVQFSQQMCPPFSTFSPNHEEKCQVFMDSWPLFARSFSAVAISFSWLQYCDHSQLPSLINATLSELRPGTRVLLFGMNPRFELFDRKCIEKIGGCSLYTTDGNYYHEGNKDIQETVLNDPMVRYTDLDEYFCDGGTCYSQDSIGNLMFNPGHISVQGARRIGLRMGRKGFPWFLSFLLNSVI